MNKRRRVLSIILGVCISLMMVGTAFAAQSFTITSGNNGTYVKGSGNDYVITIQVDDCTLSTNDLYLQSLKVDNQALVSGKDFVAGKNVYTEPPIYTTSGYDSHTIIGDVTIKNSYLDTLKAGTYNVELTFGYPEGSVNATLTVKDAEVPPSATPSVEPSKTPAAGTTEATATTTPSSDDSSKSKPQTGDDTSGIMGFAVAAILSGAALVVLGRKRVFK